jgi:GntR family transcriptional regulator / MocR family aminotransferase
MKYRISTDFRPILNPGNGVSLEQQLVRAIRAAVLNGQLSSGIRLPSSRALATELRVNRNTIIAALEHLIAEGYLETRIGSGTFVAPHVMPSVNNAPSITRARWLSTVPEPQIAPASDVLEFRVCQPSTQDFPLEAWRRAWRTATQDAPPSDYGDSAGPESFRETIAAYLRRARGLNCSADQVLVTNGAIQAINLIAQIAVPAGSSVAFEDPGYPLARQVFERHGARVLPISVDDDGLRVDALLGGDDAPHVVYVTPSHQFPLGGRLSLPRRLELLEWAKKNDALILEDDYDSEFRFDVPPLPPLVSLDTSGHVAYVGTFSKVLSPALRIGYVIAQPALLERLIRLKTLSDYHTSSLTQTALQQLIETGALERHIIKMRRVYAAKRAALLETLQPISRHVRVRGLEAGLNVFLEFDLELDLLEIQRTCAQHGVGISLASQYGWLEQPHGLILGYGGLEHSQIRAGAKQLVRAVKGYKTSRQLSDRQ